MIYSVIAIAFLAIAVVYTIYDILFLQKKKTKRNPLWTGFILMLTTAWSAVMFTGYYYQPEASSLWLAICFGIGAIYYMFSLRFFTPLS
jgi:hypothetical protein